MNETPANENKLRLIDRLSIAVTSPKNYDELVKLSTGKVVTYMILISFLLAIIEFGINAITYVARIGGFENLILNSMPKFRWNIYCLWQFKCDHGLKEYRHAVYLF